MPRGRQVVSDQIGTASPSLAWKRSSIERRLLTLADLRVLSRRKLMTELDRFRRIVVALGGNAFVRPGSQLTMASQFQTARAVMQRLLPLLSADREVVITHGNGPQIGQMLTRVELALGQAYAVPLEVCVAESEGELGYVLQQSLFNVLREAGQRRPLISVLTQVVVSRDDPAFEKPVKPIGPFHTAEEAEDLRLAGFPVMEDAGRGYRRVVASPHPIRIVETDIIRKLLDWGVIVVAAGGGGIPVVEDAGRLTGVEAVVDKDWSSELLAEQIGADLLLILTGESCAYEFYRGTKQQRIARVTARQADDLIHAGHFAAGSMLPKMAAAAEFARKGGCAVICDPESIDDALSGEAGTTVCGVR